jgi:hypothetical protein
VSVVPTFVVAGNVNQGKSSIVAALAEETDIAIDRFPGTTTETARYAFRVDGAAVFELIDTPGFQDARRALAWMRARVRSALDHRQAVADFVDVHRRGADFPDEVRLLEPILSGASILYVVDASVPPQPSSEAEMEILRWTGQAGMALLNRTRDRDHGEAWRPLLQQFFSVVRSFDAQAAGFRERMDLLRSFREVREDWRAPMDRALESVEREWRLRNQRAAAELTELVISGLGHVERRRVGNDEEAAVAARELPHAFERRLAGIERKAQAEILRVFRHPGDPGPPPAAAAVAASDLFSEESFRIFGLSRGDLARTGAGVGAAAGGAVGLLTAGIAVLPGALVGAVLGAAAGFLGSTRAAATWSEKSPLARRLFPGQTGRFVAVGPVSSLAFAWTFLDRALTFLLAARDRSHARHAAGERWPVPVAGVAARLPHGPRAEFDALLRSLLAAARRERGREALRTAFQDAVRRLLEAPPPASPRTP